jgi:hypothetical protein
MIEFGVERLKRGLVMRGIDECEILWEETFKIDAIEILALAKHCDCRFDKDIDHEIWVSGELAVV